MKRWVAVVIFAVFVALAVDWIGDATQTRRDRRNPDRQTEVVLHVKARRFRQPIDAAVRALYTSCSATVRGELVHPGIRQVGKSGEFRFAIVPALGRHGKERLVGCLNDLTIDRVKSRVVALKNAPRARGYLSQTLFVG